MPDYEDETITKENVPPKVVPQIMIVTNISTKFLYLKKGEYDIWAMKMQNFISSSDLLCWNIVLKENNAKSMTTDNDGNLKIHSPVTTEEHQQVQREEKARTILLSALPDEHIGLDKGDDKMQKILTQMNTLKINPKPEDVNMKFLRGLPPSWSGIALILKTKVGLEYISFDDLYNKLKFLEIDTKGYSLSSSTLSNAAFVSTAGSSQDNIFYQESGNGGYTTTLSASLGSSSSKGSSKSKCSVVDDVIYSFFANHKIDQHLVYEDLDQMNKEEFEEYDLKHQIAMLFIKKHKSKEAGKDGSDSKAMVVVDGSIDWDKQTEEGNTEPRSLENFGMIAGIKIKSDVDLEGEVVSANDAIPAGVSISAGNVAAAVVSLQSKTEFALMGLSTEVSIPVTCPLCCDSKYKLIEKDYHRQREQLNDCVVDLKAHKNAVKILEKQIKCHQKNQLAYEEKIRVLSYTLEENDRSSEPSTNDLQTCDSSVECSRPNHSDHDSTDSISSVSAPASETRDTVVIKCDRQEDFTSVCSIETDVKSSKTFYLHLIKDCDLHEQRFAKRNAEGKVSAVPPNSVSAEQQNTVSAGQPNLVSAGQPNPVSAVMPHLLVIAFLYSFLLMMEFLDNSLRLEKEKDRGIVDSGCSRSMSGNKDKLEDFKDFDGREVTFGGSTGKISGNGTIKTKNLNFENVLYVKELQHFNLILVSQICSQEADSDSDDEPYVLIIHSTPTPVVLIVDEATTENDGIKFDHATTHADNLDELAELQALQRQEQAGKEEADRLRLEFPSLNLISGVGTASIGSSISAGSTPPVSAGSTPLMSSYASPIFVDRHSIFAGKSHVSAGRPTGSAGRPSGSADRTPVPAGRILGKFTVSASSERFPQAFSVENSDIHDGFKIFDCLKSGIFTSSSYDKEFSGPDANNLESSLDVSSTITKRIHNIHHSSQVLGDINSPVQTKSQGYSCRNKARLVAQGHKQEEGIDHTDVFSLVARIEAIRLFLAFASFMGFMVYQMDVKSAFLYGKIAEGFKDPDHPKKVYKVVKALYGLHQAPRAWYKRFSTFLLKHGYRRATINKTLFIKKDSKDIMLVQVYVDDIIFGSTRKDWCEEFEILMHSKFKMSSMGPLTFFLGLQVDQRLDGIFIHQEKYIADILKKFDLNNSKLASIPFEP
nr:putative ribonuclease H-like domain-containing protein [Tanacetum cinerariifolium]